MVPSASGSSSKGAWPTFGTVTWVMSGISWAMAAKVSADSTLDSAPRMASGGSLRKARK